MLHWILFIGLISLMYVVISFIGKLSGGSSDTALGAVRNVLSPGLLALMVTGNILFAAALFYGFAVTPSALTISVALGIIVTFVFSMVTLGVTVTLTKVVGLALIVLGIYLLK